MAKPCFVLMPCILLSILASPVQLVCAQQWTAAQHDLWELEQAYFVCLEEGDFEHLATFWHEDFVGWPSHSAEPVHRTAAKTSLEKLRQSTKIIAHELYPHAIAIHGNVAIVHYLVDVTVESPEGEEATSPIRITHTWLKQNDTWKIIGGMSAD